MEYYINENGFYKKSIRHTVIIIILAVLLFCSGVFGTVYAIKYYRADKSLGQYIQQLDQARDRVAEYEGYYTEAEQFVVRSRDNNKQLEDILSGHISTISELRGQLEEVRRCYEEMEEYISRTRWRNGNAGNIDNNADNDTMQ
jgi:chromosome segregation ATPase